MNSAHATEEPLIEQPVATPDSLRAAVAALEPARLGEFLSDLTAAKADSVKTSSMRPMLVFYAKWSQFAALHRFPKRRERLRRLERTVAEETDPVKNRAAIKEISLLLAEVEREING
ncbi:hypothetical protein [Nocardiopsis potens]|uniref:hypothetical protein n=1 Tax=Nocardiopsis potens TaxID=1246458 RepID=UPI00059544E6|nr:hypothetical protein [Nocardiopsis potens]